MVWSHYLSSQGAPSKIFEGILNTYLFIYSMTKKLHLLLYIRILFLKYIVYTSSRWKNKCSYISCIFLLLRQSLLHYLLLLDSLSLLALLFAFLLKTDESLTVFIGSLDWIFASFSYIYVLINLDAPSARSRF